MEKDKRSYIREQNREWREQITEWLKGTAEGQQCAETMQGSISSLRLHVKFFCLLLVELGWAPYDFFVTTDDCVRNLVDEYNASGLEAVREEIDSLMVESVTPDSICELSRKWSSNSFAHYEARMRIIKEAIWAHKSEKYFLSVLGFTSQAEGILAYHNKTRPERILQTIIAERIWNLFSEADSLEAPVRTALTDYLTGAFGDFSEYCSFTGVVNRNSIFHGVNVTFGTCINSCKAFLYLDFIIRLLDDDNEGGQP